ncbi:ATP-dependent DNA helicase RecG [Actinocatenispora sera]|uniref:ATP-dependent DNA helicase RecG n=1 Tax=Actinocatenispora sera TaxID=390989 RepID=UPI0033CD74CA
MATLSTPLGKVLGDKTAAALTETLGLATVGDLLYHFPRRYAERGEHTDLSALQVGDQVTVLAQVQRVNVRPMRQRRGNLLEVTVGDGQRTLTLTFFNQAWRQRQLTVGRWGLFAGKVTEFRGKRQLNGPDFQLLSDPGEAAEDNTEIEEFLGALIPVYPAAATMPSWTVARCVRVALDTLEPPPDPLPESLRADHELVGLAAALHDIHRPSSWQARAAARKRLTFDEAFALQLTLVQRKARAADWPAVQRPRRTDGVLAAFDARLPYQLTDGQLAVGEEVAEDLARPHPMHRLLQGEVGSGKTVCALRAMLQVVDSGGQAVLLAPTEVLAAQHHRGLAALLGDLARTGPAPADGELPLGDEAAGATGLALLTGSLPAAARRRVLADIAAGTAGIVVGTHALLYQGVEFADLGLIVVDEQHRFGVEQRDALRDKATQPPHVLVMTATPIPRTVAMTVFGDLSVSSLTELPRGRSPIATHVVPGNRERWMERTWARVREEVAAGHQAYVVCPRIGVDPTDEDADEGAPADDERRPPLGVAEVAPQLADGPLAGMRVGQLTGRLPADQKDAVMRAFAAGELDVLVATTVIEVGVDVPNATVMVVLDADRFGVSQLHQLRGRVGRGSAPGLCLLVSEAAPESPAHERLTAVASTVDGFRLAELDLEQRREGDVLGAAQSGRRSHLRLLSLLSDAKLIAEARDEAVRVIEADRELTEHPLLAETVAALVDEDRAEYLEKG